MSTDPESTTTVMVVGHPSSRPIVPDHWTLCAEFRSVDQALDQLTHDVRPSIVLVDLAQWASNEALTSLVVASGDTLILGWCTTSNVSDRARAAMLAGFDDVVFQDTLEPKVLELRASLSKLRRQNQLQDATRHRWFEDDLTAYFVSSADGSIIACNSAFLQLFGFESLEQALQSNSETLYARSNDRYQLLNRLRVEGAVHDLELELRRLDGSPLFVIEHVYGSCDRHGELVRLRGYIFDITARIQLEEQLRQSQKMEAVGRLAGGLVHDFNNILTVIQGHALLLSKQLPSNESVQEGISQIEKAAERAVILTRQLLSFSRKRASMQRAIDLSEIIDGMIVMLGRLVGESYALETECPPATWPVRADPHQIEQVIMNLVLNARDAMAQGGAIKIDLFHQVIPFSPSRPSSPHPASTAGGKSPGDYVVLRVEDQGTGIEPDILPRVFDPFFTTKSQEHGTGLGLSTVYANVEQNGGFIEISTEVGAGTRFDIFYPRDFKDDDSVEVRLPLQRESGEGSETILIVEDDQQVREVVGQTLRRAGYRVISAEHSDDALEVLRDPTQHVDLLFIDVVLPGKSGPEIVTEARQIRHPLRVLYMSGHSAQEVERLGLDADLALLQKPFLPGALARKVRQALELPPLSR